MADSANGEYLIIQQSDAGIDAVQLSHVSPSAPPPPPRKRPRESAHHPASHRAPADMTARRVATVIFSGYEIQCGYPSPYPLEELHSPSTTSTSNSVQSANKSRASLIKRASPELSGHMDVAKAPHHKRAWGTSATSGASGSNGVSGGTSSTGPFSATPPETQRLFICDGCFKYMLQPTAHAAHMKTCTMKHPPGRKVYQRGAHTIWEIDGAVHKLYCQLLCLFSKLFIEHKYMFFDVEGFTFYVLTDATPSRDYVIGYFSKEKISYDDNNLACIVTYPPYQKKGYGTLLIEFSYELDRRTTTMSHAGSPERPLSPQGERGYTAYWTATLVRYFRAIFDPPPPDAAVSTTSTKTPPRTNRGTDEKRKLIIRRSRGWDGELPVVMTPEGVIVSPPQRPLPTPPSLPSPSSRGRYGKQAEVLSLSLEQIAHDVHIRPDDVIFALTDSGLAQWRLPSRDAQDIEGSHDVVLVITPELVEEVAKAKRVKPLRVLDLNHVVL